MSVPHGTVPDGWRAVETDVFVNHPYMIARSRNPAGGWFVNLYYCGALIGRTDSDSKAIDMAMRHQSDPDGFITATLARSRMDHVVKRE